MAMNGFDIQQVGYADQNLSDPRIVTSNKHISIQNRLFQFFKEFEENGILKYNEVLKSDYDAYLYRCEVNYEDLTSFDPNLAEELRNNPTDFMPDIEIAARKVIHHGQLSTIAESSIHNIQVQIVNYPRKTGVRNLNSSEISRLISVEGIVISASKIQTKATEITIQCRNCNTIKKIPVKSGFGSAQIPRNCDRVPLNAQDEKCPMDPFAIVADDCEYVDCQTLKLQENPEAVPTGEMPRNIMLHVSDCLVNQAKPGSRVTVVGILCIMDAKNGKKGVQNVATRFPYIRALGLQSDNENSGSIQFTTEEEEHLKTLARDENIYEHFHSHIIAPDIYGHDDIKKAVACQMFGGVRQHLPDGLRLRGDMHVLLLGDPSVAKSQFLKFAEKCSPIAIYTSGKGSSAAGLTASVIRDIGTGEFHLEGGALVLGDGGIVCIDEFDKMRPQDRVAIHEAMEQQTISIAKAGITTILNSRAGILAAANPVFGRYDDMKSPEENIDFQSTILSRFDMIFVILDKREKEKDFAITKFVISMHQTAMVAQRQFNDSVFKDMALLKKYIAYARNRCFPCLSTEASSLLVSHFITVRENMRKQASENGQSIIPITVRQLEAIIRISESLARMQLQNVATVDHVKEAIRLFQVSTLNAAQSGSITGEGLVGSDFGDRIKKSEVRILRRVPIASDVAYGSLIRELVNLGEDEAASIKAIDILVKKGVFTYKQQKKVLHRVN